MNIPNYRFQDGSSRKRLSGPSLWNFPGAKSDSRGWTGFLLCVMNWQGILQILKVAFLPMFYLHCTFWLVYGVFSQENYDQIQFYLSVGWIFLVVLWSISFWRALATDPGYITRKKDIENQRSARGSPLNNSIELSGNWEWKSKSNSKKSKAEIELLPNEENKDDTLVNNTDK